MAQTKEMTYSIGRTINNGNFNSTRVDVSETIVLEHGDDPVTEYNNLRARCIHRLQHDCQGQQQ